ncbi:unnamed protein product [Heligmosomoides polygyrus]|uniref:Phlebovirus glycoprotein G2 fusion domain-containing protein n=1 Tax=Heligmosomoides polygyrus TaxID=6339 RepID=A0A183FZY3_HELPZ|nr:unnamed protein product [Heligmosomoides polygyrus]
MIGTNSVYPNSLLLYQTCSQRCEKTKTLRFSCSSFSVGFSASAARPSHFQNFITKQRGPPNRKQEPLTYDNHCDDDPWIIKVRSVTVNPSGTFSKMTFRGCYDRLFDVMNPATQPIPDHNFCTAGEVQLTCLSDASVTEHSCWCEGDYCNGMRRFAVTMVVGVTIWISCF